MEQEFVDERTPSDVFENAIRRFGVVAACEWFGYPADSEFTLETARILKERVENARVPFPLAAPAHA